MRPRKFMSRQRKPDGGGVEGRSGLDINDFIKVKYNKLDFKTKKEVAPEVRLIIKEKIKLDKKISIYKQLLAMIITLIIMSVIIVIVIRYNKSFEGDRLMFKKYTNQITQIKTKYTYLSDYDRLVSIENFKNGKKEKESIYYDYKTGGIKSIENYSKGKLISKIDFYNDKNYKIIYQIDVDGNIYHGKGIDFQGNLIFEGDIDRYNIYNSMLYFEFSNYVDYRE